MYRVQNINEDRPWTEMCDADLRNELERGENLDYIADFMCRRPDEIMRRARTLGLQRKVRLR